MWNMHDKDKLSAEGTRILKIIDIVKFRRKIKFNHHLDCWSFIFS